MGTTIDLDANLTAYVATPAGEVKGALVLIHEIWGLVPNITNIADRFADEGYLVIAPDILSGIGIVPEVGLELQSLLFSADEQTRSDAQPVLRDRMAPARVPEYAIWAIAALKKAVDHVATAPGVNGRIAVTGFCFGGGYAFALAGADSRITAAVPFYGQAPASADVTTISCPVLAFYGDQDASLMATLPAVTTQLTDAGVDFRTQVFPGVGHAFFNDTNSMTYDVKAAAAAWQMTLAFLAEELG
jgi:carboxymethylenebutenolidase